MTARGRSPAPEDERPEGPFLPRAFPRLPWLVLVLAACDGGHGSTNDAGADAKTDRDGEAETAVSDAQDDGDDEANEPAAGPLTFLADSVAVVGERACDMDGDGDLDSAIADLGPAYAELLAGLVNSVGETDSLEGRLLVHFPWVEDLRGPDDEAAPLIVAEAVRTDGGGASAALRSLDECLEPRYRGEASVAGGELSGQTSGFPLKLASDWYIPFEEARFTGSVEPRGASCDLHVCVVARLGDLGLPRLGIGHLSLLEGIVSGGSAVGIPGVPGVTPDIDLDGDGLERIFVDESGQIASCVDGDSTIIEGRDCWQDERMADGISITARIGGGPIRFAGIAPGGRQALSTACAGGALEESRWGSCGAEACERWSSRACEPACGGEGREHCAWSCDGYGACIPAGRDEFRPSSCDELSALGGASCDGDPPTVRLVDGPLQTRGVALAAVLPLGSDALVVEARARLTKGASTVPCCGWSVIAYLDDSGEPLHHNTFRLGVNESRPGYMAHWRTTSYFLDDEDDVRLRYVDGGADWERSTLDVRRQPLLPPGLDAGTVGPVEQTLRLSLVPDLEETSANEQAVLVQALDADGEVAVTLACSGADCPVPLVPGLPVTVVVGSGTIEADSVVELVDLDVEVGGLCP